MPTGSGLIQTGSATATAADQLAIGAIAVDYASTGATASNSFSLAEQNASGTPNSKVVDKTTTGATAQSSVITLTGAGSLPTPSYSAGTIVILREAAGAGFDRKKSSMFLTF